MFEVPSLAALLGHGHLPTEYDIDIRERKGEDDPPSLHSQTQWWYCHFFPYLAGLIWAKKNWIFHQINDRKLWILLSLSRFLLINKCQFACQIYNLDNLDFPCNYFVHNKREQNCQFLSSTDRKCDVIRGPPTPSLDNCPETSTEWNRINLFWQLCFLHDELSWLFTKRFRAFSLICKK